MCTHSFIAGLSAYRVSEHEEQIRAEIYKNGPVEAAYTVYADFLSYKSGTFEFIWIFISYNIHIVHYTILSQ